MQPEGEGGTELVPRKEVSGPRRRLGTVLGAVGIVVLFVSAGLLGLVGNRVSSWVLLAPLSVALVLIVVAYFLVR